MKQKAFTLVELLVVIAIIGLIASFSVIALGNARSKSRDSKRVSDIKQIQTALELFFSDQGRYPSTTEWATGSLYATGTMGTTTYMERLPVSSNALCSGGDYNYRSILSGASYSITSCLENPLSSMSAGGAYYTPEGNKSLGPVSGLVGYWPFNEGVGTTTYDVVGTNNGVLTNGPVWQIASDCKIGSCLLFDRFDDYVYLNSSIIAGAKTITVWTKISADAGRKAIFGSYIANVSGTSNYLDHYNNVAYLTSSSGFTSNTWNHLSFVLTSDNIKFYINGALISQSNSPNINAVSRTIGIYATGGSGPQYFPFSGYMDDVRLYNRALSTDEIKAIYDATK